MLMDDWAERFIVCLTEFYPAAPARDCYGSRSNSFPSLTLFEVANFQPRRDEESNAGGVTAC